MIIYIPAFVMRFMSKIITTIIYPLGFPGIILHKLSHKFFCDVTNTKVFKINYYSLKTNSGYIEHEIPDGVFKAFLISIGPFIINTLIAVIIISPIILSFLDIGSNSGTFLISFWLGISLSVHAFPYNKDMDAFIYNTEKNFSPYPIKLLSKVLGFVVKVVNYLGRGFLSLVVVIFISYLTLNIFAYFSK